MDGWRFNIFTEIQESLKDKTAVYFGWFPRKLGGNTLAFDLTRVKAQKSHVQTSEIR